MTEKELKRLSRAELLELLLIQTRETEKLRSQLARAAKLLNDRRIAIEKSGDLAQAVLSVNSVIDAATTAANQYLYNIEIMEQETKERCRKMLAEAQAEAARIRGGAQQELVTTPETPASAPAPKTGVKREREKPRPAKSRSSAETLLERHLQEINMLIGK